MDNRVTIDLQELYCAILKRKCQIEILTYMNKFHSLPIRITEDNGVSYIILLHDND